MCLAPTRDRPLGLGPEPPALTVDRGLSLALRLTAARATHTAGDAPAASATWGPIHMALRPARGRGTPAQGRLPPRLLRPPCAVQNLLPVSPALGFRAAQVGRTCSHEGGGPCMQLTRVLVVLCPHNIRMPPNAGPGPPPAPAPAPADAGLSPILGTLCCGPPCRAVKGQAWALPCTSWAHQVMTCCPPLSLLWTAVDVS